MSKRDKEKDKDKENNKGKKMTKTTTLGDKGTRHGRHTPQGPAQRIGNVLVLYGHCPNSFRLPPPSVKRANVEKKCSKPPWQALTPLSKHGEKNAPIHPDKPLHPTPLGQCQY